MRANFCFFALFLSAASIFGSTQGQAAVAQFDVGMVRAQAAAWLEQQAMTTFPGSLAQAKVGDVDARLRLPACSQVQFFLPANAQIWGRGSLGVRCELPSPWMFYLGYQNRISGPALVATRPIAAREALIGGDLVLRQIDYVQSPDLYPRALPAEARLNRPLAAGQAFVIAWLSLPPVIQAGRQVRLQTRTATFTVSQEGTALNTAVPGEAVRVKTPGGRIVQGTAQQDGTVAVRP